MQIGRLVSGIGGIAFGFLTVVALFVGNPPGGNYDASNVAAFVAPAHRAAVVVVLFLGVLAVFGLVSLLAHLREAMEGPGGDKRMPQIFWGTGVTAAAMIAIGHVFNEGPAIVAINVTLAVPVIYLAVDLGAAVLLLGGVLLALALIVLALSRPSPLAPWLRWLTLALGIVGLASLIFIPFFALLLWGIVTGVWVLAAGQEPGLARPRGGLTSGT